MYIFYFAILALSFIIPRAGTKVSGIPLTVPSILFGIFLLWWVVNSVRLHRPLITRVESAYLLYLTAVIPLIWIINLSGDWVTAFKLTVPVFVPFAVYFWMYPVTRTLVNREKRLDNLMWLIVISTITVCFYGLLQKLFGHYQVMVPGLTMSYADSLISDVFATKSNSWGPLLKITSTFQNGNIFGTFLTMVTPIVWAITFYGRTRMMKLTGFVAVIAIFTIMPFTLARSVFFGTFLGSGLMLLVIRSWYHRFIIAGCLLYSLLLTFLDKFIFARMILSFFDPTLGGRTDGFERLVPMLSDSTKGILLGVGSWQHWQEVKEFWMFASENFYLTLYTWSGIIGLVLFFAIIIPVLFKLGHTLLNTWYWYELPIHGYGRGIFMAIAAYMIQALIEGAMSKPPTGMNFWFLVGMAAAVRKMLEADRRPVKQIYQ